MNLEALKVYAKKVDEGIDNLHNLLLDPYNLCKVTEQSSQTAKQTIEQLDNEFNSMKNFLHDTINDEPANREETNFTIKNVVDFISVLNDELGEMSEFLSQFDIQSLPKINDDNDGNNSYRELSYSVDSLEICDQRKLILEESPIFSSPNYNSTPDSYQNSQNGFSSIGSKMRNGSSGSNLGSSNLIVPSPANLSLLRYYNSSNNNKKKH